MFQPRRRSSPSLRLPWVLSLPFGCAGPKTSKRIVQDWLPAVLCNGPRNRFLRLSSVTRHTADPTPPAGFEPAPASSLACYTEELQGQICRLRYPACCPLHRTPSAADPLPPTAEHGSTASSTTQDGSSQDASRTGNRRSHRLSLADDLHSSHRQRNYRNRSRSHASRTLTAEAVLSRRWQRCRQQSHNQHDCRPEAFHNQILLKHGNQTSNNTDMIAH